MSAAEPHAAADASRTPARLLLALTLLAVGSLAFALPACGDTPLTFSVVHVPVGYDASEVLDADILDPDRDGDADVIVATSADLRYLECDAGRHRDASSGTGLGKLQPVERLHRDGGSAGASGLGSGGDYLLERDGQLSRLVYSGIGSWREEPGPVPATAPAAALEQSADIDGDGLSDRVRLVGRSVIVELQRPGETHEDVTARSGADGLLLPGEGRRLCAGDIDADGDIDLVVVGGRLFALVNNGGT